MYTLMIYLLHMARELFERVCGALPPPSDDAKNEVNLFKICMASTLLNSCSDLPSWT